MKRFTENIFKYDKVIVLFLTALAAAGILSFGQLSSGVYPELSFPRLAVIAQVGDFSPEQLLFTATKTLEEACSQVRNVKRVRSKSIRGFVELSVDFIDGTNMPLALHELQNRLAEISSRLPLHTQITSEMVTPSIFPVIAYNLSSKTLPQTDLYMVSRFVLQPILARVDGVARVQIQGGDIPQIKVEVSPDQLRANNLSIVQIADCIRKASQIAVVGRSSNNYEQLLIESRGSALSVAGIEQTVLPGAGANLPLEKISGVAKVTESYRDRTSLVTVNSSPGIVLNIYKQPGANVVALSNLIGEAISKSRAQLPADFTISPSYDEAAIIRPALQNVQESMLIGLVMILVVLFCFLRNFKSTFIAALTIPLSVLAAFLVMRLLNESLNLMSLGGIAIAIGLVVDDAIVVVENIERQLEAGLPTREAIAAALGEIASPIVSSTLTTLVVFLPLGFLSGVTGQFFRSLTVTLSTAVLFSLFLAFASTPMLAALLLKPKKQRPEQSSIDAAGSQSRGLYEKSMGIVLAAPWLAPTLAIVSLALTILVSLSLKTDFLPALDEGAYVVDYVAPSGASLETVDALAKKLEKIVSAAPEVKSWTGRSGSELGLFATETTKGDILVSLKEAKDRKRTTAEIITAQRAEAADACPQLDIDFHQILQDQLNDLSGSPKPVEIKIFGNDSTTLKFIAKKVQKALDGIKGLVDLNASNKQEVTSQSVLVNSALCERIGLAPQDVQTQIKTSLMGEVVAQIVDKGQLIDVIVHLTDATRFAPGILQTLPIKGTSIVPLASLAEIKQVHGEQQITCENQVRYAAVDGELENADLGTTMKAVEEKLRAVIVPPTFQLQISGLYESQKTAFRELTAVLLTGLFLVYFLMVVQFRSFIQPLMIVSAIPTGLLGAALALRFTDVPLNISSFMGLILLVGLIVKNGIILLEFANRLKAEGYVWRDALLTAAKIRFRPIAMTTICSILGLLPLALNFGSGAEMQKPLAIVVIGGLLFSTFATLVVVPGMSMLFEPKRTDSPSP